MTDANELSVGPSLPAGLAAAIAEEVMGWKPTHYKGFTRWRSGDGMRWLVTGNGNDHWSPSTDIGAAGEVLQWVRQQDEELCAQFFTALAALRTAWAEDQDTGEPDSDEAVDVMLTGVDRWFIFHADIPLAISHAALAAVRARKEKPEVSNEAE